ncbi:MAG: hypothetical protein ACREFN_17020 [Acetobacteraceae bacterium]
MSQLPPDPFAALLAGAAGLVVPGADELRAAWLSASPEDRGGILSTLKQRIMQARADAEERSDTARAVEILRLVMGADRDDSEGE